MADAEAQLDERFPYGLDRPAQVRLLAGLGMGAGGLALIAVLALGPGVVVLVLLALLVAGGAASARMLQSSRAQKVPAADRLLDGLDLRGDERALDLGCGTGLLCAGLAVRLPDGHVTGVDLWEPSQLTPTGRALARRSLKLAGVHGVDVLTASVRELPLRDGAVDVVVSRDALALCGGAVARREAIAEVARVLAPGGRVALLEPRVGRALARELRGAGLVDVAVSGPWWRLAPAPRLISASAPA